MRIVCLGDSLTAGYGVGAHACWVALACAESRHAFLNRGICGDCASDMLARFSSDVMHERPDAVLLLGGSNDILFFGARHSAAGSILALAERAVSAGITPMIGTPPPLFPPGAPRLWDAAGCPDEAAALSADYAGLLRGEAAARGYAVVDFFRGFSTVPAGSRSGLYLDGVHLTQAGNRLMADILLRELPFQVIS
jgi:lysophospholipase L1-like esterase